MIAYNFFVSYLCASKHEQFMASQGENIKNFFDSFQNRGGRFHILENRVPVEQQKEYFKYAQFVRKVLKKMDDRDFDRCQRVLESVELPKEDKKKILALLASSAEVKAYRMIEKYIQHPDEELLNWASMALMECKMGLESELLDEKQIYISTGLGGKEGKLRYYVLILSFQCAAFKAFQRRVIEKEFGYVLPQNDCEIERLTIKNCYLELVFLIPVTADFRVIIESVIEECNIYGNFLSHAYIVTNIKELNQSEINQIIRKTKKV